MATACVIGEAVTHAGIVRARIAVIARDRVVAAGAGGRVAGVRGAGIVVLAGRAGQLRLRRLRRRHGDRCDEDSQEDSKNTETGISSRVPEGSRRVHEGPSIEWTAQTGKRVDSPGRTVLVIYGEPKA